MSTGSTPSFEKTLERLQALEPWTQFDEWIGVYIQADEPVCAFFSENMDGLARLMILRGSDPCHRYQQYRNHVWTPEFGIDFATSHALQVRVQEGEVVGVESLVPGQPPASLKRSDLSLLETVVSALEAAMKQLSPDHWVAAGEHEDFCVHVWKVGDHWKSDVQPFPDEVFVQQSAITWDPARVERMIKVRLPREGIWEGASFYLPVTRVQGDQEVFVQCAGMAERSGDLLGLVTLEAHADPDHELAECLMGSIEKQGRIPQILVVRHESTAERLLELCQALGISLRIRWKLKDLEHMREQMIDEFPEDDEDEESRDEEDQS